MKKYHEYNKSELCISDKLYDLAFIQYLVVKPLWVFERLREARLLRDHLVMQAKV